MNEVTCDSIRKKRLPVVDIAKGIVIILMVLGHTSSIPILTRNWIYSFHMPFFFMISGALTNFDSNIVSFLKKKTISLIVPFSIYSLIVLLLMPLSSDFTHSEYAAQILNNGWGDIALWFVPILYVSLFIVKLYTYCKSIWFKSLIILFLFLCTYQFNTVGRLPWAVLSIPLSTTFVIVGYYLSKVLKQVKLVNLNKYILYILLLAPVSFVTSIYSSMDIARALCENIPIAYLSALVGSTIVLMVSMLLFRHFKYRAILEIVGQNTFVVLALSQVIIIISNRIFPAIGPIRYILMTVVLALIVIVKDKLVNKYYSKPTNS